MKRIVTVFHTTHGVTVGNANRISRMNLLENNYCLIILTNNPEFVRRVCPKSKVIRVGDTSKSFFGQKRLWLLAGVKLLSIKFDLLFAVFPDSPVAFFKRGRPFLCHIHQSHEIIGIGENVSKGIKGIIKKIFFLANACLLIKGIKMADYNFTVSRQLKEFFIKKGIKKSRIEYLPHGVDTNIFNNDKVKKTKLLDHISPEVFVMTYTGWVGEKRGLSLMLDGLLLIKKRFENIHLVVVGAGESYIKLIKQYALDNNLVDNISIFGSVEYSEIPKFLKATDVCLSFLEVNASYSMSPPQKIFEYFAMGKPVIANKIPTHTDYITDSYNGIIINDLEPIQFANRIIELINEKERLDEMGKNALNYSKEYNMKIIEKKLLSKIDELLVRSK